MNTRVITYAVLALFAGTLCAASVVEARIGGGGSGGSRGSRSYSAPRPLAPATPGTPTSPAAPRQPLGPQPATPRPGGFFGGLGGMLGGLLLGGLIGSLLFGGGHGFGIGLMDVLLIGGLAYLAFALFRRRAPEPALAAAGGGRSATTAWAPAAEPAAADRGAALFDDDVARGVAAIRTMDAGFDPQRFAEVARDTFTRVQGAWSAGDLSPVRADLTDEMARVFATDLARLKSLRRVNRLEKLAVEASDVTEAWQEYGQDFATVRFRASAIDYTVDETTGGLVDGNNTVPTAFEEYWTFTRPVGPNAWRLSAIQQPAG